MSVATAKLLDVAGMFGRFLRSSIGAKVIMSLTGVVIWGYAIGHLAGNLQVFMPAPEGGYAGQQINEYAHFLKTTAPLLWGTRIVLLVSFFLHIVTGMRLARENRAARPSRYAVAHYKESTLFSRIMPFSGLVLLAFVLFHLAHYTLLFVQPAYATYEDKAGLHDVYQMVWDGFRNPAIVIFYVVSMALLFAHLWHGSVSFLQSLGIRHRAWTPFAAKLGRALVLFVAFGNIAIPVILLLSWVNQQPR